MNPFEMLIILFVIYVVFAQRQVIKAKRLHREDHERSTDLDRRLEAIERRIANLETIVIDREKKSEFQRSLDT